MEPICICLLTFLCLLVCTHCQSKGQSISESFLWIHNWLIHKLPPNTSFRVLSLMCFNSDFPHSLYFQFSTEYFIYWSAFTQNRFTLMMQNSTGCWSIFVQQQMELTCMVIKCPWCVPEGEKAAHAYMKGGGTILRLLFFLFLTAIHLPAGGKWMWITHHGCSPTSIHSTLSFNLSWCFSS